MSTRNWWGRFAGQGKINPKGKGKQKRPSLQNPQRLRLEVLELREMLSGLSITSSALDPLQSRPALTAASVTPTTLNASWPAPVNGVTWNLTVAINGALLTGTPRTGTLTLASNGAVLASVDIAQAAPTAGTNSYALTVPGGLPLGLNQLRIDYSGDANYGASAYTATLTIHNDNLSLSYSTQTLIGQPYAVNVAIVGPIINGAARTGTLSLVEGATTLASADVATATPSASGYYPLLVSGGFSAGGHSLKVNYTGDAVYDALSINMATVNAVSTLSTSTYLNGPTTVAAGQPAIFTASVSAPGTPVSSGTVTLYEGNAALGAAAVSSAGVASFTGINLALGSHTLTANYSGATAFHPSASSALSVKVVGALTTLSYNWPASYTGQPWTMNVGLNGALLANTPRTGTITLTEGTTTLASVDISAVAPNSSGYYALAVAGGLSSGPHSLKAAYSGDANYGGASAQFTLTARNDALSVSYSNAALIGQPYTVKAAITGPLAGGAARTGTLSLVEGATTLVSVDITQATPNASGYYALTVDSGLAAGSHSLKVVYSGDAAYDAVTFNMATVNAVSTLATSTYLSGPTTTATGVAATYTARVAASGATVNAGTVTFLDGTTVLGSAAVNASGLATFQTSDLSLGSHTLTASYAGAPAFNASTSAALSVSVVRATTTLSTNWSAPYTGQPWTINVKLNGALLPDAARTGTIALAEGATTLASIDLAAATPNSNGYYALTLAGGLTTGAHAMKLTYSGDANYGGAMTSIALTVRNDALSVSYSNAALIGQPYTVRAAITGPLVGGAARTGTLSLVEGATVLAAIDVTQATPSASGHYALVASAGLTAGSHSLKVVYSGDAVYDAVTYNMATVNAVSTLSTSTYLSGPTTVAAGQAVTFSASVSAAGAPVNGGTATLLDGATELKTVAVGSTGAVSFTGVVLSDLGAHALTARYNGAASFHPSASAALSVKAVGATCSLGCNWSTPLANQSWTLKAAINGTLLTGAPRTGVLTLTSGTAVLATVDVAQATPDKYGCYSLAVPGGLPLGSNTLRVAYTGDANYGAASTQLTINVANVSLSLSYNTTAVAGAPFTVNAALGGPLVGGATRTGTLTLREGTTVVAAVDITTVTPNANGSLPVVVSGGLTAGTHSFKLIYSGDAIYSSLTVNLATITANLPA